MPFSILLSSPAQARGRRFWRVSLSGYSLTELLIALIILIVISGFAFASFKFLIVRYKRMDDINQIKGILTFARQQAIARSQTVTLCASKNLYHCDSDWAAGQMVFWGKYSAGITLPQNQLLTYNEPLHQGSHLTWHGFRSDQFVQWQANGLLGSQNGTFCYSQKAESTSETAIILNRTGRFRVITGTDAKQYCK